MYGGKGCAEKFVEDIEDEVKWLYATFPQQTMTKLTDILEKELEAADKCHIFENRKVRDHCHFMSLYRGAACNNGNLKYRMPDHKTIVFHMLSGYDAHLFIKELGNKFNKSDIGVIAENKENYISFNVQVNVKLEGVTNKDGKEVCKNIQLRFIDICRIMASSPDKLESNLCYGSGIQCDKCKGDLELINISNKSIALLERNTCKTKITKI